MTERMLLKIKRKSEDDLIAERLQKVLATSGLASRRSVEDRIQRGDVKLNGEVAIVGAQVRAGDRIEIDSKRFVIKQIPGQIGRVLIYNKPDGEITSRHDPEGRATVFEKLPKVRGARWISIGRLDINTQGLLIFSTNGDLAHRLMHPSQGFEREYVCRIFGEVSDEMIDRLVRGVELEDGPAHFESVSRLDSAGGSNEWYQVTIGEGRNREVRRMWEAVGVEVSRLKRVKFGPFSLPKSLHRGEMAELDEADVERICAEIGLPPPQPVLTVSDEREKSLRRNRSADATAAPGDSKLKAERAYLGYLGGQYVGEEGRRERSNILPDRSGQRDSKRPVKGRGRRVPGQERILSGEPVSDRRPPPPRGGKNRRGGDRERAPAKSMPMPTLDNQPRFDYDPLTGTFSQAAPGRTPRANNKPGGRARKGGARPPVSPSQAVERLFKSDAGYKPPKYVTAIDPETGEIDGNRVGPNARPDQVAPAQGNSGQGNSGQGNSDQGNSDQGNSGQGNSGEGNLGQGNSGRENSGQGNSGRGNSGRENSGRGNSGRGNSGRGDSGRGESGRGESGRGNSGRAGAGKRPRHGQRAAPDSSASSAGQGAEGGQGAQGGQDVQGAQDAQSAQAAQGRQSAAPAGPGNPRRRKRGRRRGPARTPGEQSGTGSAPNQPAAEPAPSAD